MRRNELALWGIFCIAFFVCYLILNQQSEAISKYSYLISAFVSVSAMMVTDRVIKKRSAKEAALDSGSSKKKNAKTPSSKEPKVKKVVQGNSKTAVAARKNSSSNAKKKH